MPHRVRKWLPKFNSSKGSPSFRVWDEGLLFYTGIVLLSFDD